MKRPFLSSAFVMATATPQKKRVSGERALMMLSVSEQDDMVTATVSPAAWLGKA